MITTDASASPGGARALPAVAWLPIASAVAAVVTVLAATSARYGYHRDELYFRMPNPPGGTWTSPR